MLLKVRMFLGRTSPLKLVPTEARQDSFLAFGEHIMELPNVQVCILEKFLFSIFSGIANAALRLYVEMEHRRASACRNRRL